MKRVRDLQRALGVPGDALRVRAAPAEVVLAEPTSSRKRMRALHSPSIRIASEKSVAALRMRLAHSHGTETLGFSVGSVHGAYVTQPLQLLGVLGARRRSE